tara:strand:+ start:6307 stop:7080 length:774 start_codon:yes stop_codon:yes gene_type:complete
MISNKSVYISIVSHKSFDDIKVNFYNFPKIIMGYRIIIGIVDNFGQEELKSWCKSNKINYYFDGNLRGYGANHNLNFEILSPKKNDPFIILNPDVIISKTNFKGIINYYYEKSPSLFGVRVYESLDFTKFSSHNRSFPALFDPIISFFFRIKLFENDFFTHSNPDWIGGAFMAFKSSVFKNIGGFDETFFMYYEDIDVCRRLKNKGFIIDYNPEFYITHLASRDGRILFSKHFFYNLKSMIKYFFRYPTIKLFSFKF